jgi:hypothetical protein
MTNIRCSALSTQKLSVSFSVTIFPHYMELKHVRFEPHHGGNNSQSSKQHVNNNSARLFCRHSRGNMKIKVYIYYKGKDYSGYSKHNGSSPAFWGHLFGMSDLH